MKKAKTKLSFLLLFTFTSSTIFANEAFRSNFNGVDLTVILIPSILVCFIILALNKAIAALEKEKNGNSIRKHK